MFDRVENLFPRSAKRLGGFFPGKPARPAGQEQHIGFGQGPFAVAPGDFLDEDGAATATIDAPHGVQEEDEKSPERDELEAPLGELVVTGRGLMTARTDGGRTLAWPYRYLDTLLVRTEPGLLVNKSPEAVAAV